MVLRYIGSVISETEKNSVLDWDGTEQPAAGSRCCARARSVCVRWSVQGVCADGGEKGGDGGAHSGSRWSMQGGAGDDDLTTDAVLTDDLNE